MTRSTGIGTPIANRLVPDLARLIRRPSPHSHTTFTVGTAGSFTVTTTGFPTSRLSETGTLPGGVTFTDNHDGTATLSGTPTAGSGGTYNLTFTASNGVGTPPPRTSPSRSTRRRPSPAPTTPPSRWARRAASR